MRGTTTYEYINTYYDYDYISINTMKMFVVLRYWNMDSIYICCHAHMYICIWRVCICIVRVCGHALHSGILERRYFVCTLQRPLVHFGLEAKKKKKKKKFVRSRLFLKWPSHRWTTDCWRREESLRVSSSPVRIVSVFSSCLLDISRSFEFCLNYFDKFKLFNLRSCLIFVLQSKSFSAEKSVVSDTLLLSLKSCHFPLALVGLLHFISLWAHKLSLCGRRLCFASKPNESCASSKHDRPPPFFLLCSA